MNIQDSTVLVMIPLEEWELLKATVRTVAERLEILNEKKPVVDDRPNPGYLTAVEFMHKVQIRRTKLSQLISENRIRYVRKSRKIYIPETEVERYFKDPGII